MFVNVLTREFDIRHLQRVDLGQQDAETVNVGLLCVPSAREHFGRDPRDGADVHRHEVVGVGHAAVAKVIQTGIPRLTEEDILRLEIAMNDL